MTPGVLPWLSLARRDGATTTRATNVGGRKALTRDHGPSTSGRPASASLGTNSWERSREQAAARDGRDTDLTPTEYRALEPTIVYFPMLLIVYLEARPTIDGEALVTVATKEPMSFP